MDERDCAAATGESVPPQVRIERPLYETQQLRQDLNYCKSKPSYIKSLCRPDKYSLKRCMFSVFPISEWIPKYDWKTDLPADLISGFTVAVMHIPQGMAYALLGNVPAVVGIYMAFFPVLIYFFLGTSRHNSMGTFAVVCLMTGKSVLQYSDPAFFPKSFFPDFDRINASDTDPLIRSISIDYSYKPIEVATAVTFVVALFQIAMYFFRLGAISALLSETLVSGFTTAAAIQVVVSQIKDLFGIRIPKHKGYFVVIKSMQSIFQELYNYNTVALIISAITITCVALNNEVLKPIVAKRTTFPVPIELIAVVAGTLISNSFNLAGKYNVSILGDIPQGLPEPTLPNLSLFTNVALDGLSIAIVSYTITLSMALIFAQKLNYEVDANQELLAMGAGNLFGSFFSCMPVSASLSRSNIQQSVGGKSQIASVVSCGILVVILLWIGPFFEPLPKAVLAGIIVVSLKGMLMQVTTFFHFLKQSKLDALVWIVTFLTVVLVSIDIGLLVGVIMSLVVIFIMGFRPYTCLLGHVPRTDLYLDVNRYKGTEQIPGIKIFHYCGGINFATKNIFKNDLLDLIELNPQKEVIYRKQLAKLTEKKEKSEFTKKSPLDKIERLQNKVKVDLKCLILDFSSLSYIDPSGVGMLRILTENFKDLDIPVYIAGSKDKVYDLIQKCNGSTANVRFFSTIHDAVLCSADKFNLINANSVSTIISRI